MFQDLKRGACFALAERDRQRCKHAGDRCMNSARQNQHPEQGKAGQKWREPADAKCPEHGHAAGEGESSAQRHDIEVMCVE